MSDDNDEAEPERNLKMVEDESDPSDPDYATPNEEESDSDESDYDVECYDEVMERFHLEVEDSTKPKRIMHCKKCGQGGHNSRSCAKRAKRTHGEGSGSQSTELMSQVDQA
ncbi:predicted protein [Arabidopsis lyrata subsp. lyrata]|uniref:Predicted protein n=1 Tax=Arabidopsis lyrata subsp. lyrata TaxID=81972 RepID=D7KVN5_ARALL|nr:predicted protein [Arabidopsis lyrata subsp. lyrata]